MRISDWSSDVCSSDLAEVALYRVSEGEGAGQPADGDGERHAVDHRQGGGDRQANAHQQAQRAERKSHLQGKSASIRVNLGSRRIIKHIKHDSNDNRVDLDGVDIITHAEIRNDE